MTFLGATATKVTILSAKYHRLMLHPNCEGSKGSSDEIRMIRALKFIRGKDEGKSVLGISLLVMLLEFTNATYLTLILILMFKIHQHIKFHTEIC